MIQSDQYGFEYYEWPSEEWIMAKSIWEFVDIDPKSEGYYNVKLGLRYFIYSGLRDVYETYEITEHTRDYHLTPYIKQGRLFYLS